MWWKSARPGRRMLGATSLLDSHNGSESHMITAIAGVLHCPSALGIRIVPRLRRTERLISTGASCGRSWVRFRQCGGGVFLALAGDRTEHVSRRVAVSDFSHPRRVDSWHWSYVGQLERLAHAKPGE